MTLPALDDRLHALSDALADAAPPSAVDRSIAAAIASADKRRRRDATPLRAWERWLAWPVALAASIFAISFVDSPWSTSWVTSRSRWVRPNAATTRGTISGGRASSIVTTTSPSTPS